MRIGPQRPSASLSKVFQRFRDDWNWARRVLVFREREGRCSGAWATKLLVRLRGPTVLGRRAAARCATPRAEWGRTVICFGSIPCVRWRIVQARLYSPALAQPVQPSQRSRAPAQSAPVQLARPSQPSDPSPAQPLSNQPSQPNTTQPSHPSTAPAQAAPAQPAQPSPAAAQSAPASPSPASPGQPSASSQFPMEAQFPNDGRPSFRTTGGPVSE